MLFPSGMMSCRLGKRGFEGRIVTIGKKRGKKRQTQRKSPNASKATAKSKEAVGKREQVLIGEDRSGPGEYHLSKEELLHEIRDNKVNISALARAVDLTQSYVHRLLHGERISPSFPVLQKFGDVFGLKPSEVLEVLEELRENPDEEGVEKVE